MNGEGSDVDKAFRICYKMSDDFSRDVKIYQIHEAQ